MAYNTYTLFDTMKDIASVFHHIEKQVRGLCVGGHIAIFGLFEKARRRFPILTKIIVMYLKYKLNIKALMLFIVIK